MKVTVKPFPINEVRVGVLNKVSSKPKVWNRVVATDGFVVRTDTGDILPIAEVKPHKLYCLTNRNYIGELAYNDYDKVEINKQYEVRIVKKRLVVPVGAKVRITKVPLCMLDRVINHDLHNLIGTVVSSKNNDYVVAINDTLHITLNREFFVSLSSKDCHCICYLN